jgi:myo-inositol-hexaphosphate 3-phosphohydrolase
MHSRTARLLSLPILSASFLSVSASASAFELAPIFVGDVAQTSAVFVVDANAPVLVEWALASDPTVAVGSRLVAPLAPNAPAKLVVSDLLPGTRYVVRASVGPDRSPESSFATPRLAGRPGFAFGVSGDWRGELAPYPAIGNADARGLDLFVRLGDTVYGDVPSPAVFMPQCFSLDEFRLKHREVYSARFGLDAWGDLALVTPSIATIDDHEVTNDFSGWALTTNPIFNAVPAVFESPQFTDDDAGGSADADDPAIWVHPTDPTKSRVLCVAKNGGLRVYDLEARELQSIAPNPETIRYNNIDILRGLTVGTETIDVAVVTDRLNDLLVFFRIDPVTGLVSDITDPSAPRVFPDVDVKEQETAYGVATYTGDDGTPYVFVSKRQNPTVRQVELVVNGGLVGWTPVRDIDLPDTFEGWSPEDPQVEGMVADEASDILYIGQEQVGFWRTNASPFAANAPVLVDRVREFGGAAGPGTLLAADVEGLAIADFGAGTGDLLVSSQGDSTFAIYDRVTNAPRGRFAIGGGSIDAVEECDGAAISTNTFGGIWPGGLLVVQDGNDLPAVLGEDDGEIENLATSFKFLGYSDVRAAALAPAQRVNETLLYQTGIQVFEEWNPLLPATWSGTGEARFDGKPDLYRTRTYGDDAAIFVVDARSFRDAPLPPADPTNPASVLQFLIASFNPTRTMLGVAQRERLKADLLAAQKAGTTWKFVMVPEPIQNFGVLAASDRFEGYAAERTNILKFIDDHDIDNVVFVAADVHGTLVNNLTYQLGPGQPQIPTNSFEITTGSVAFDAPFGPTVLGIAADLGIISEAEFQFYLAAPAPVQEAILQSAVNAQLSALGYDPLGLEGSPIDATITVGGATATNSFGWTEFAIAPGSRTLTVTTWGIEPYTFGDLLADPLEVVGRVPQIVGRFVVRAVDVPCVGDLDGSGSIDGVDLATLLGAWGSDEPNLDPTLDLDGSGDVGSGDLAVLLGTWGTCD